MLGRLISRFSGAAPTARVDWHPRAEAACTLLADGDWPGLAEMVAAETPSGAVTLLRALGRDTERDASLRALPERSEEMAVFGAVLVGWAWQHRGFGTADEVADDAWAPFYETLDQAITALLPAARADRHDGVTLAFLVRAATGAQQEGLLEEAGDLFLRARRRPLEGACWLMQGRGAKWGGSHAAMDRVVETLLLDDDLHPARVALEARALIERWLYDGRMAGDAATQLRGQALFALRETAERVEAISENYARLMSVWDEGADDPAAEGFAHDNIGLAAVLAKRWDVARTHVEALGDTPSEWPWVYSLGTDVSARWAGLQRRVARGR